MTNQGREAERDDIVPGFDIGSEMSFEMTDEGMAKFLAAYERAGTVQARGLRVGELVVPIKQPNEVDALVVEEPGVLRFRTKGGVVGRVRVR